MSSWIVEQEENGVLDASQMEGRVQSEIGEGTHSWDEALVVQHGPHAAGEETSKIGE